MMTRWKTEASSWHRGVLQAFPKWDIPGADARQLRKAWEKQVQDYEQLSGDKSSNTIVLGVVKPSMGQTPLCEDTNS